MRRCGVCGEIGKKMRQADSPSAYHPTPSLTGEPSRRGKKNVGRKEEKFGPALLPHELAPLYSHRRLEGNNWGPFNQIL